MTNTRHSAVLLFQSSWWPRHTCDDNV